MLTIDTWMLVPGIVLALCPFVVGIWALRRHSRMFPNGFDRTDWNLDGERAGWFMTESTWLSGGRS